MTTSFPEKTFEHWASQYIAYRFRSKLGQWWPAAGADIQVDPSLLPIGKAVWLELKTSTPSPKNPGIHEVEVDVAQLISYHAPGTPPVYYVIPRPDWHGTLGTAAARPWLRGTPRTDIAFRRSGTKWFGNWTVVIAGWSLYSALLRNGRATQKTAKLGHWDGAQWTWSRAFKPTPGAFHPEWSWQDFWYRWQRCGSPQMPSTFVVPAAHGRRKTMSRNTLVTTLRPFARSDSTDDREQATLEDAYGPRSVYAPQFEISTNGVALTTRYTRVAVVDGSENSDHPRSPEERESSGDSMLALLPADETR